MSKQPPNPITKRPGETTVQEPSRQQLAFQHTVFSGPIPPAEALAAYAQIKPEIVDIIVGMAEREQSHRHVQERDAGKAVDRWMIRGQVFGALLGTLTLGIAGYAVANGQPWVAGVAITSITGLVGAFLWKERSDARKDNEAPKG